MKFGRWLPTALLALTASMGCQQAPMTRPRILSVQTPAGVPPAPSLSTTRNNPLIVPTAPVRTGTGVVVPVPAAVVQPPTGAVAPSQVIQVPAAPPVGVSQPNAVRQYVPSELSTPQPIQPPAVITGGPAR